MLDFTVDSAYTDRLSSINERNERLNNINTTSRIPYTREATTQDTQDLQQKILELKVENLKLKVESLESAAIKNGDIPDPYKSEIQDTEVQSKPVPCNQENITQPQDKLAELNAAKAELAAAKAELASPSGDNSNKNIKELRQNLFELNVENKELQRNALLEEQEALSAATPATTPIPCNQNPVNPRENELKIELAAAEKELKAAQNLLEGANSAGNAPQFVSKNYVKLLSGIASESINDSKEYRKEQLETKIEKLEANLDNRPSNPQPCLNQQNNDYSNTEKMLAEAKAELATIKN
ncbi:MAG: hypothetical protein ACKO3R_09235 [bacterium]